MARRMSRQLMDALQELERRGATIIEAPESLNEVRMILDALGPQRVGGRYVGGYGRQTYTVVGITVHGHLWQITVKDSDGTRSHRTAWDYRRDRVA